MTTTQDETGGRQQQLLRLLLRHKRGMGVEALVRDLAISRTAVRQHLASLERDGLVRKGASQPSGGRPEQLYVLSPKAAEQFPRQYSWFAELLLQELAGGQEQVLRSRLADLGRKVGVSVAAKLDGTPGSPDRVASLAAAMNELGYDATASDGNRIDAFNCVYHTLAQANPEVCAFDLALLESCSGMAVEHQACMVRGGGSCHFRFLDGKGSKPG